ncbi:capsule biosynthesis protein [Neotabrizicola shimadae]|uniref:Capsule biosynthesis protein n=1 Tax=Neotabrizicola shimadae TaxID=2807096 RepID=A0A8G0ZV38_9RHOB|nr:capsule biosynthesis protein [Neotabrizicola shimadae]QYZ70698.1 capsule biosynthesis protein [Neotabrizicola shimadae]
MTTKLKVRRFRTRRPDPVSAPAAPNVPHRAEVVSVAGRAPGGTAARLAASMAPSGADLPFAAEDDGLPDVPPNVPSDNAAAEIDAIRREGLTGRQLRMARRLAQAHNLPATSDFDAVRLLRKAGVDPFQRTPLLELVNTDGAQQPSRALAVTDGGGAQRLPATISPIQLPSTEVRAEESHAADILRIQRDIVRRRRRRLGSLALRLFFFVTLPTLVVAWYYFFVATPLYGTHSEFVIQQAEPVAPGLGSLLAGTQFATAQDSMSVQGYLQSRDAMTRLNADKGFTGAFEGDKIDFLQRLPANASADEAYSLYQRNVQIAYDPTEGIIKMEVIAPTPAESEAFSRALIGYAEEQVDAMTKRLREDQMQGARESLADAEQKMLEAQQRVVDLQQKTKVLSSEVEVQLLSAQITELSTLLAQEKLSLAQMESNANPNVARMEPVKRRIATLEQQIQDLRDRMTQSGDQGQSLAEVQGELLVAQADVQTRQLLLAQAVQAMEAARVEANRQVRYLSLSVSPIAPDTPTYPRAWQNTAVAFLIFAGIYLMISMTVAILREQVTA